MKQVMYIYLILMIACMLNACKQGPDDQKGPNLDEVKVQQFVTGFKKECK